MTALNLTEFPEQQRLKMKFKIISFTMKPHGCQKRAEEEINSLIEKGNDILVIDKIVSKPTYSNTQYNHETCITLFIVYIKKGERENEPGH